MRISDWSSDVCSSDLPAQMKKADVDEFFYRLATADPEPTTELQYVNDYTLLVAVVLSAQATDIGVNKATRDLFETVRTPPAMLALGEDGLKQHISSEARRVGIESVSTCGLRESPSTYTTN